MSSPSFFLGQCHHQVKKENKIENPASGTASPLIPPTDPQHLPLIRTLASPSSGPDLIAHPPPRQPPLINTSLCSHLPAHPAQSLLPQTQTEQPRSDETKKRRRSAIESSRWTSWSSPWRPSPSASTPSPRSPRQAQRRGPASPPSSPRPPPPASGACAPPRRRPL